MTTQKWLYKDVALSIDGMKIRKHVDYDQGSKKCIGFVDCGGNIERDDETLATEALVIMAVGVHGSWKLPLGYFLIGGISGTLQGQLVKQCLELLNEVGVNAVSITLDGHQTNMSMIRKLGCSTNPDYLTHHFPHPITNQPVYVFLDACHGLKLIRNQFCSLEKVSIPGVGEAKWQQIVQLHLHQKKEGLTAANKLTDRHIAFQQQKMKVSLAAQTLSSSVAVALDFLRDLRVPAFHDSEALHRFTCRPLIKFRGYFLAFR